MSNPGNGYHVQREGYHVRSGPVYTTEFSSRRGSSGYLDPSSLRSSHISGGQVHYTTGRQSIVNLGSKNTEHQVHYTTGSHATRPSNVNLGTTNTEHQVHYTTGSQATRPSNVNLGTTNTEQQVYYTTGSQQVTGSRTVHPVLTTRGSRKKYVHKSRGVGYVADENGQDDVVVVSQPNYTDTIDGPRRSITSLKYGGFNRHINPDPELARPKDYLTLSLFSCLCCFCPVGLVALFFSLKSRKSTDLLEFHRGYSNGRKALKCALIAIVIGIVLFIIMFVLLVVSVASLDRVRPADYHVFG